MYAKICVRSIALLMVALSFDYPAFALTEDTNDEKQAVEQANDRFYRALNDMFAGAVAPMEQVWSHADDITCLGPEGGITVGWEAIRANWEAEAALGLGGRVEPSDVHTTVSDNLAVIQCYEKGNNEKNGGEKVSVAIRATNVFRKENGEWRMIGHHTDILPFLQQEVRTLSVE